MTAPATTAPAEVRVERASCHGGHALAVCTCGWQGTLRSTRTVEGYRLAERDAAEHLWSHLHGAGWFDYRRGWIVNPTPCDCHYTTGNGLRALVEVTA